MDRRRFLTSSGGVLLLSAKQMRGDHRVISANPLEIEFDLASLEGRNTPIEDFFIRNHHETPRPPERPFLSVVGEVASPVRLRPTDLSQLKKRQVSAVLECAGNPVASTGLVSSGIWSGWSMEEVLQLARPSAAAAFLHLFGRDGFSRSLPIERARGDAMVVTHLGGHPLQPDHGAPWRAFFPGQYGMDSVKWLERIVVSPTPLVDNENEYAEMRPATPVGIVRKPLPPLQVKSIITSPTEGSVVRRGTVEVRGLAWCGEGRISRVEVSGNPGATWRDTGLSSAEQRYEWVLWRGSVELNLPGSAELVCRATDSQGHTQPERRDAERLDGYAQNRYHRVEVVVV